MDDVLAALVVGLATFFAKKANFEVVALEVEQAAENLERKVTSLLVEVGALVDAEPRLLDDVTLDRLDVTCDRHERYAIGDQHVLEVLFQALDGTARGTIGLVSGSLGVCHDNHLHLRLGCIVVCVGSGIFLLHSFLLQCQLYTEMIVCKQLFHLPLQSLVKKFLEDDGCVTALEKNKVSF